MGIDETMIGDIRDWATARPDDGALFSRAERGDDWSVVTWREYWERVRNVGQGLIALGVHPGESVAIVADNRPEWVICQHGIAAAGAVLSPIYATMLPSQVAHIVDQSGSRIVIVDTRAQFDKLREAQVMVDHIVTIDDLGVDDPHVITMAELEARGADMAVDELDDRLDAVARDDVALRVYTSGTSGVPKGAELTHEGIRAVTDSIIAVTGDVFEGPQRGVSYLPLCHAAEQVFTNFLGLRLGSEYYFCPDIDQFRTYLGAVRPTILLAVPHVWERFETAIRPHLHGRDEIDDAGAELIRQSLGIDQVAFAVSGAAPIAESTLRFFDSLGVVIHDCYGMTETTGVAAIPPVGEPRIGTVGRAIPGVEARISDHGELMLRGANMVRSYHKLPEQTAELWDGEWMRTGDLASIDDDGFITITGRAKDLLITAGGHNVGPVELENHLVGIEGVAHAVAVGDGKPYLTAVLTLDPEELPTFFEAAGLDEDLTLQQAANHERVREHLQQQVDERCNAKVAPYQQIKKFEVLAATFGVETGELTPTMKIKRDIVADRYAELIEGMYAGTTSPGSGHARPRRDEVTVRDNPDQHRYEVYVGEAIAGFAVYHRRGGRYVFVHTEIDDSYSGRGVGSTLARKALDDVRGTGASVVPLCPFVAGWIDRHPAYVDLVDNDAVRYLDSPRQGEG